MQKNPYNPKTEPASYKFFEDKCPYRPINDNNSKYELVKLKDGLPYCIKHGAMNKVSSYQNGGYWRCLYEYCRAGCEQFKNLN